jgi:tRNA G10  N-methylase Trm11
LKIAKYSVCLDDTIVTHNFWYFEEWENDLANNKIKFLKKCYFTKQVKDFNKNLIKKKNFLNFKISEGLNSIMFKFNLKNRTFIANTSMDPILAFIMSNMAKVRENYLVFDPFVGSGSLLVGSAFFGAHVLGADLDYNLLHAKGGYFRD